MGTASRDMYKFVWDEGDDPYTGSTSETSPKDIVANILRETELPDLDLRGDSKRNTKSKKSRGGVTTKELSMEHELFSIDDNDDEDYDFDQTFNISSRISPNQPPKPKDRSTNQKTVYRPHSQTSSGNREPVTVGDDKQKQDDVSAVKSYERKALAKVPPVPSVHHPRLNHLEEGVVAGSNSFSSYRDEPANNNEDPRMKDRNRPAHKTALLPLDSVDINYDDDVDSGVADTDGHADTQPIVTLDQGKLTARWRTRRQKINFLVALGLVILGVVVITVTIILVVKMVRSK